MNDQEINSMQNKRTLAAGLALAALAALAGPALAQATFTDLGSFRANSVSADGTTLIGTDQGQVAKYDVATGIVTLIGASTTNGGISATGVEAAGNDTDAGGFDTASYYDGTSWTFVGGTGGTSGSSRSTAYALSSDGTAVVGLGWENAGTSQAFRWTTGGGMENLGTGGFDSRANGVNADGSVVVGWAQDQITGTRRATFWTTDALSFTHLPELSPGGSTQGDAKAVTPDGGTIVGSAIGASGNEAFKYQGGVMTGLGLIPGKNGTEAYAVSDTAQVIVGGAGSQIFGAAAFIWTNVGGMEELGTYLTDRGANLAGAQPTFALGCSADGTVICGLHGGFPFVSGFVATIPAITTVATYCTAKTNSQGCTPVISSGATATISGGPGSFDIGCTSALNNKPGVLFYGFGAAAIPFQGGFLCVQAPTKRTPVQFSGGNPPPDDCSGTYNYDFGGLISSGSDPNLSIGAVVNAQYWMRDPLAAVAPTGLSNAVEFTIFN